MRYGITFPTMEIGTDVGVIREWISRAGALGFDHVVIFDHVLGVDAQQRPDYAAQFPPESNRAPYVVEEEFHEPLTMLAYISALAPNLELATGILVSPQRQTALLAKQVAQLDLLSRGKVRLCVGVGWNPVEFEALQVDFRTRGRRMDAQLNALRSLWTQRTVSIQNEFEHIVGAGLAPTAVQQPIPLWIGAYQSRALERVGRLADGWFYARENPPDLNADLRTIRLAAEAAGRDPDAIGLEGAVQMPYGLAGMADRAAVWERYRASHLVVDPHGGGYRGAEHIAVLDRIAEQFPLSNFT